MIQMLFGDNKEQHGACFVRLIGLKRPFIHGCLAGVKINLKSCPHKIIKHKPVQVIKLQKSYSDIMHVNNISNKLKTNKWAFTVLEHA